MFNLATITKSIALSAVVTVTVLGASNTYAAETNRLSSDIEIREFNEVASKYNTRPTFLHLIEKKKFDRLKLAVDFIRAGPSIDAHTGQNTLIFSEKRIDDYVSAIDKYLSWHDIALKDGDIFTKDISRVKSNSSAYNFFKFHSGSASNHYLIIHSPTMAAVLSTNTNFPKKDPDFVFDYENAKLLKQTLIDWKSGKFEDKININIDDKYK